MKQGPGGVSMTLTNGTALCERQDHQYFITAPGLTLVAILAANTGYANAMPPLMNGTHAAQLCCSATLAAAVEIAPSSLRTMLTEIRSYFQFNATDLAAVLNVSRPTMYSWSAERSMPHRDHVQRIQSLRDASLAWRYMIGDRTDSVAQRFGDKERLLTILSGPLDNEAQVFGDLLAVANARRAAPRVESIAERLHRLGFAKQTVEEQRRALRENVW